MTLKMLDDLAASSELVSTSFLQHKDTLAERLSRQWAHLADSEEEVAAHVAAMIDLMERDLSTDRQLLVEAGHQHQFELGADKGLLVERDEAASVLASRYITARDLYSLIYGKEAALAAGFEPTTSPVPSRLLSQVSHLLKSLLKTSPPDLPEDDESLLTPLDHARIVRSVMPAYERLRTSLRGVLEERRAAETTLIAKNTAFERHTVKFRTVSRCGEMLFILAGMPEEAARIRPSVLRSTRRAADVEGTDPPPPPDGPPPDDGPPPSDPAPDGEPSGETSEGASDDTP